MWNWSVNSNKEKAKKESKDYFIINKFNLSLFNFFYVNTGVNMVKAMVEVSSVDNVQTEKSSTGH